MRENEQLTKKKGSATGISDTPIRPFKSPKDQLGKTMCSSIDSLGSGEITLLTTNLKASEGTYYHALGTFGITFSGTFKCSSKRECSFSGKWDLRDKYDWHEGLSARVLGRRFDDSWALLVEEYHNAHPFDIGGSWNGTVVYSCGCFIEDQGANR